MLEAICTSSTPLRVSGLSILLEERKNREMLSLYTGDLLWGILGSIHSVFGSTLKAEKCTSLYERLHDIKPTRQSCKSNEFVKRSIIETLKKYAG